MNEKFLNLTGLSYYHSKVKNEFASQTDFDTLEDKVDDLIAEGGEPNKIDSISVNGTTQTITDKNVDITVPTKVSDLTNDGDGQSPFATESYVDTNGGKIDVIKVNGTTQTITNKTVDITVPTKVSDLTNDSNFVSNTDYATNSTGGVIKTGSYSVNADGSTGNIYASTHSYSQYGSLNNGNFISKGTLENVLTGKGLIDNTVNNLTNYYLKSETYTKSEVDDLISAIETLTIEIVDALPTQDISTTTIYFLKVSTTPILYDEYVYITTGGTSHWEKIGSTDIDLSTYWNNTNLVAITTSEIDTIVNDVSA